jgi:transposase-like protein
MKPISRLKGSGSICIVRLILLGIRLTLCSVRSRDRPAATRVFRKALKATHTQLPRVINVDKNAAYPRAIEELKKEEFLPPSSQLRQNKYLNNIVEQDHSFIKRLVNPGLGFKSFYTARITISGYETMNMIRKGQLHTVTRMGYCLSNKVYCKRLRCCCINNPAS